MSSHLTLVTSDSPAILMDRMALDLGASPLPPLADELIVVHNYGMRRWVTQELAKQHGCAASLELVFPGAFCRRLAQLLTGEQEPIDPRFGREALAWRILDLLERDVANHPDFAALQRFTDGADTRKRLGLAVRAANCLDDYQLYRPDVLAEWEANPVAEDESPQLRWQHALWRELCADDEPPRTLAHWFERAFRELETCETAPAGLPPRVTVFGIYTLPPHVLRLLRAVARFVPVRVYVLAPPRATWAAQEVANPLFRAFGHTVREMIGLLGDVRIEEHHAASSASTSLQRLRDDLRHGCTRGREAGMHAPVPLDPADPSLSVHVCHSPMREMEVLRDQLFAAFAADPTLRPHDVLVLVPDTATYAPLVEAVFDVGEPDLPRIPHRVADRPIAHESSLAGALFRILQLAGARWTVPEIVELLDVAAVRRAAGISDRGAQTILDWIEETRIRWGRDAAMRKENFGLPAIDANTWRAGINRLLMGYAVGPADDVIAGVLPHAGHTVGDPQTLGAFARWLDRLFDLLDEWRTPRPLSAWRAALRDAVTALLSPEGDDEEYAHGQLLRAIDTLEACETNGNCHRAVDLAVVRDWLERSLSDEELMTGGFLTGGMVVAAFKPMRAIPFRVVAVVGLDDANFPRTLRRAGYDLLEVKPREGDPDRRAIDRQLFLETILSATDRLILTYVGRSARDNTERAASVVVAELLDIVDDTFAHGDRSAREAIVVEHRLQPFSPDYYASDPRLFSYSRVNARATAVLSDERTGVSPFVPEPLPSDVVPVGMLEIRLPDLIECWANPSRFFCRRVLDLHLPSEEDEASDCEPMFVDGLRRYQMDDDIVRRHLAGDRAPERDRIRATLVGDLPSGELAGLWFDRIEAEIATFLERIGSPKFIEPATVEVTGSGWRLVARVDQLTETGRFEARPAKRKPKDLIRAWITHLVLCTAREKAETTVVADDCVTTLPHVADAMTHLDALVAGYRAALRAPLPVFESASWEYVSRLVDIENGKTVRKPPLDAARDAFRLNEFGDFQRGDLSDAHVELCWRGRDPFGDARDDFQEHSATLWRPLLASMVHEKAEVVA